MVMAQMCLAAHCNESVSTAKWPSSQWSSHGLPSSPTTVTDPLTATIEPADDAEYAWWRDTHPDGYVLAVRARQAPLLHRARCPEVDRDRHPGRLRAKGSRQICADSKPALRAWAARELPEHSAMLPRCPKCAP
jgi:glucose/arabinose dehydrogenase